MFVACMQEIMGQTHEDGKFTHIVTVQHSLLYSLPVNCWCSFCFIRVDPVLAFEVPPRAGTLSIGCLTLQRTKIPVCSFIV